eukprot:CAMPEP_0180135762 /NCGR_PEP_ID=MMETSP0986-20121125/11040_1 /TAXON_ID=697907 /ORGANISM="non described non described, Strain CCMP2293" /LENGTH=441 /DNA_ID=CAMNT_0022076555 /DNA_START=94 /DNA_END=1419 /DNA_ORIENTATION=+
MSSLARRTNPILARGMSTLWTPQSQPVIPQRAPLVDPTSRGFSGAGPPAGSAQSWLSDNSSMIPERIALSNSRRVVVKVGTAVVSNSDGTLALARIGALVEAIKELKNEGRQVLLVSSGAVGLGRLRLGLSKDVVKDPANVIDRQACAAAGQGILMSLYDVLFQRVGISCAQVLITQSDLLSRERYSYLTDTLDRLASLGCVPIINENDVVTGCSELDTQRVFSDNDKLSSLVAAGSDADGLALLTDVTAVFDKPPDQPGAKRISIWKDDDIEIGEKSTMGRGGMASKISAARVAALGGVQTCVASGYDLGNIKKVFSGEDIGTLFPASARPNKRQRWMRFATTVEGSLTVSAEGRHRILQNPVGGVGSVLMQDVRNVTGMFDSRAVVSILDEDDKEIGRGMVQLSFQAIKDMIVPGGSQVASFHDTQVVMRGDDYVILDS